MTRVPAVILLLVAAALPARASETPVKTLDEINIEGELRLPQVLFITSRDSVRPLDFLALYASPDAAALCETVPSPGALHVGASESPATMAPAAAPLSETHQEAPQPSKEDTP